MVPATSLTGCDKKWREQRAFYLGTVNFADTKGVLYLVLDRPLELHIFPALTCVSSCQPPGVGRGDCLEIRGPKSFRWLLLGLIKRIPIKYFKAN